MHKIITDVISEYEATKETEGQELERKRWQENKIKALQSDQHVTYSKAEIRAKLAGINFSQDDDFFENR